ncbi:MAG TPA: hypothetical protein VG347_22400 [Verrucomicrobiae bacterium]|nr:hypothetical protein [Verrucomicrobiae bacterium]
MRKLLLLLSLWLGVVALAAAADTYSLVDGGSVAGDVVKFDDNGIMIHTAEETFTNVPWARFSQDALKQLSGNPKLKGYVDPFIVPTEAERPPKPVIQVNAVVRPELPANPSIFGGLFKSGLGLFILLLVYAANLYAAFEISIVKARAAIQVMGVAAVLPIIGPVIFLIMPMYVAPEPEEVVQDAGGPGDKPQEKIQIGDASWKQAEEKREQEVREKKPEAQVFSRGKFTFNKRFIETKFAAYVGGANGEQAKKFTMEVKTMKDHFMVEHIAQIGAAEVIFETPKGQVTVAMADIQEIKLNPKTN